MRDPDHPQRLWKGPWMQAQTWDDLLFAHWPIPVEIMRRLVPQALTLDTFDGQAWLGVVPFGISGFRARFVKPIPGFAGFLETNLRTYVTRDGTPGVFFFSLDAARRWAVKGARAVYHLPYFHATMRWSHEDQWIRYDSQRIHRGAPPAVFSGRYRPTGDAQRHAPHTLDYWLTERYCLYAVDARGNVFRAGIQHPQWRLQPAELEIETNTLAQAAGLTLPDVPPLLHFSRRQAVIVWPPVRVNRSQRD